MRRLFSLVGALGLAASFVAACSDGVDTVDLRGLRPEGGAAGAPAGRAGSNGLTAAAGSSAGTGGTQAGTQASSGGAANAGAPGSAGVAADSGGAEPPDAGSRADAALVLDAGDGGPSLLCVSAADCDDANPCTTDACDRKLCAFTPVAIGTACGDTLTSNECTTPDTCDGNGVCLANDQPEGTPCGDGLCTTGRCDCAVERVTAVPYGQQWQTDGNDVDFFTDCQTCANTVDHVVVFTAPSAGSYRFRATAVGDAELAVLAGDCASTPGEAVCGEDIDAPNLEFDDQLDLALAAGDTVTVVVAESCEEEGGDGNLIIELTPQEP